MICRVFYVLCVTLCIPWPVYAQGESAVRSIIRVPPRTAAEAKAGVTWVLSIGVENYRNIARLKYTGDDARAFANAFTEVGLVDPARVHLVADGERTSRNLPTDAATLKAAIQRIAALCDPNDTFVLYFSGHGYADPQGVMYLAANDFDISAPAETGIPVSFVRQALLDCPAKTQLLFLDTCHSGAFNLDQSLDGKLLATELAAKKGIAVICSSSGEQYSIESPKLGHGVFTHWLVKGLRGQANYEVNSWIDVHEAYRFVSTHVPKSAEELAQREQTPAFAAKNLTDVPKVLDLKRPDRPSALVAAENDVPLGNVGYDPTLIAYMGKFAAADPVKVIGRLKWIMENSKPGSENYQAAETALQKIDAEILAGRIRLPAAVLGR